MFLFKIYRHKKHVLFGFGKYPIKSHYVIPAELPMASQYQLQVLRKNRELRVYLMTPAEWVALVTDAGISFRQILPNDQTATSFILQNEQPLMVLLGINAEKVFQYSLTHHCI